MRDNRTYGRRLGNNLTEGGSHNGEGESGEPGSEEHGGCGTETMVAPTGVGTEEPSRVRVPFILQGVQRLVDAGRMLTVKVPTATNVGVELVRLARSDLVR